MIVNLLSTCIENSTIEDNGSSPALNDEELTNLNDSDTTTVAVQRICSEEVVDEYIDSNSTQGQKYFAQPFRLSDSANIVSVKVKLCKYDGGDYNIICYLQECLDNGDPDPDGQLWQAQNTVNSSEIQNLTEVEFNFSPAVSLEPNKLYCIKLAVDDGQSSYSAAIHDYWDDATFDLRISSDGTNWNARDDKMYYKLISRTQETFDIFIDIINGYAIKEIQIYTDDDQSNNWQVKYSLDNQTWIDANVNWDADLCAQKVTFNETTYLRYIQIYSERASEGTTNIYEIMVIADDSRVDFGSDGSLESYTFTNAPSGDYSEVQEIPVYNDCSQATAQTQARIRADGANGSWYAEISVDQNTWKRHCKYNDLANHQCTKGNSNYATSDCKCTCPDYEEDWLDLGSIDANSAKTVYARSFIPEGTSQQSMGFMLDAKHAYTEE